MSDIVSRYFSPQSSISPPNKEETLIVFFYITYLTINSRFL